MRSSRRHCERPGQDRSDVARLAREWEQRADELVNEVRGACARTEEPALFLDLVREADDVADALEEAAFSWSLLPQGRFRARCWSSHGG